MSNAWDMTYTVIGVVVGLLTILGALAKFVLLPYLQRELFGPVQRTHHQVTVNHHSSDEPTILDRLDDVWGEVRAQRRDLTAHLLASGQEQAEARKEARAMWSAIEAVAKSQPPKS